MVKDQIEDHAAVGRVAGLTKAVKAADPEIRDDELVLAVMCESEHGFVVSDAEMMRVIIRPAKDPTRRVICIAQVGKDGEEKLVTLHTPNSCRRLATALRGIAAFLDADGPRFSHGFEQK
jgi:hypothetical protein